MDLDILSSAPLFAGISQPELEQLEPCLGFSLRTYQKGEAIFHSGSPISEAGLVVSGSVRMEYNDFWGNRSLLDVAKPGQMFGEAYACLPGEPLLVDVTAHEDTVALFIRLPRLLSPCEKACPCHVRLIRNLLAIASRKNVLLSRRTFLLSSHTIRERLLSFFSQQRLLQGQNPLRLPFDRQQMADYLGVERTALSKELGKMQREGLITFRKNEFFLHESGEGDAARKADAP